MKQNYTAFIDRVIKNYEGGYGWDKGDTGGPTKYGITCYDLAEHRGKPMTSMSAWAPLVQAMTLQEAEDIYDTKYANGCFFDSLRSGPDCCILDYGINSGVARPLRVARSILKFNDPSNPKLVDAINAAHAADPKWFVDAMCQERLAFMHAIRGGSAWATFGRGWSARVADVQTYCDRLSFVPGSSIVPSAPPVAPVVPHPKVTHGPSQTTTQVVTKTVATGAGSGAAAHVSGAPAWVLPAVIGAVVVGGIAFAIYESRKATVANTTVVIPPTVPKMPAAVVDAIASTIGVAPHAA